MQRAATAVMDQRTFAIPFPNIKLPVRLAPRKRNVCVFDPNRREHQRTLEGVLKDLVDVHWFADFLRESLESGELAKDQNPDELAKFKPVMIIVELNLIPNSTNWRDGVKLIENFRRSEEFDTGVEIMIISNAHAILAAQHDKAFDRLNVKWTLCWDLLYSPAIRRNIQTIVRDLLKVS